MLTSLRYGFWDEWENPQRCTFSGAERIIYVNPGVTEIDVKRDIYSDWKEWVQADDTTNACWLPAVRTIGGDPISETEQLGDSYFLTNGWRIMPWEGSYRLSITGNLYTDEGDSPFIPTRNPSNVAIVQKVSSLVLQPLVTNNVSVNTQEVNVTNQTVEVTTQQVDANALVEAMWQKTIEQGYSAEEIVKLLAAVMLGKVSGAGTGTESFRSIDDSKTRIIATVDENGNRTEVLMDAS